MTEETEIKEVKDKDVESSENPLDSNEELSTIEEAHSQIKLSGLIGTKIGMTQTITDDGKVIPTTVIKLGPCLALEKKVKNNKFRAGTKVLGIPFSLNSNCFSFVKLVSLI